ncbi:MAG: hypothetical protein MI749_00290 [Desulfovibrionales bacterium]|nr:hypothetical protein [Desulfovibrionales bacterium]
MHKIFRCAVALCVLLVFTTGCKQAIRNTWRDTKGYYNTYLNTPAELKFAEVDMANVEQHLAAMYTPVGEELELFIRTMQGKDVYPDVAWLDGTMKRFSWLSGISVVNAEGKVLMQRPAVSMKPLNVAPLLADDTYGFRELRAYVDETVLGKEAYVGMPFYVNNEMKGLIVAHFDARSLIERCPEPEKLIVLAGEKVLWSGSYQFENTPFAQIDWKTMLAETSYSVADEDTSYTWLVRYVGRLPLIFGTMAPVQVPAEG